MIRRFARDGGPDGPLGSVARWWLVAALALALAGVATLHACGGEESPGDAWVVEDSAGVHVVEFDLDRVPARYALSGEPLWVVGESGDVLFERVAAAMQPSDSLVVVADGGSREVSFVARSGDVRRVGGTGDGPTEFHRIASLHPGEDGTVTVFDDRRERAVRFDREGRLVGARDVDGSGSGLAAETYVPLSDGSYIVAHHSGVSGEEGPGVHRNEGAVLRVVGADVDTIGSIPGGTVAIGDGTLGGVPFGATTKVAPAPGGVWVGDQARALLERWSATGEVVTRVRWTGGPDRAVTEDRLSRFVEGVLASEPDAPPEAREALRDYVASVDLPENAPAFQDLLPDGEGGVWMSEYPGAVAALGGRRPAALRWIHLAADGVPRGSLVTPEGFEPLEFRRDRVVGRFTDALDVESVRIYGLESEETESAPQPQ